MNLEIISIALGVVCGVIAAWIVAAAIAAAQRNKQEDEAMGPAHRRMLEENDHGIGKY